MKPIQIAIIEDDPDDQKALLGCLHRYDEINCIAMEICLFSDGESFLKEAGTYDLIFMDIEMPGRNGIETARVLRNRGFQGTLVLVTNMIQYAIHGYEVQASDYIVKPVLYEQLALKFPGYLSMVKRRKTSITIKNRQGIFKLRIQDIIYVEVYSHNILFHLRNTVEECSGSLREYEEQLKDFGFARCSQSYLVNLAYVTGITQDNVQISTQTIPISRREKKAFLSAFTKYDGGFGS